MRPDAIRKKILHEHKRRKNPLTWREIAAEYGVNVGHVYNFAVHGEEPKKLEVRLALGLPVPHQRPAWLRVAIANLRRLEQLAAMEDQSVTSGGSGNPP